MSVKSVEIPSFYSCSDGSTSYMVYELSVNDSNGHNWKVLKRFSEFHIFEKQLKNNFQGKYKIPSLPSGLPAFPGKVSRRQKGLAKYLGTLCKHPEFSRSILLLDFLGAKHLQTRVAHDSEASRLLRLPRKDSGPKTPVNSYVEPNPGAELMSKNASEIESLNNSSTYVKKPIKKKKKKPKVKQELPPPPPEEVEEEVMIQEYEELNHVKLEELSLTSPEEEVIEKEEEFDIPSLIKPSSALPDVRNSVVLDALETLENVEQIQQEQYEMVDSDSKIFNVLCKAIVVYYSSIISI